MKTVAQRTRNCKTGENHRGCQADTIANSNKAATVSRCAHLVVNSFNMSVSAKSIPCSRQSCNEARCPDMVGGSSNVVQLNFSVRGKPIDAKEDLLF